MQMETAMIKMPQGCMIIIAQPSNEFVRGLLQAALLHSPACRGRGKVPGGGGGGGEVYT